MRLFISIFLMVLLMPSMLTPYTPVTYAETELDVTSAGAYLRAPKPVSTPTSTIASALWKDCISSEDYAVELIMPTAFGLPAQIALLTDGSVVITDFSNGRILLFHDGTF